VVSVEGWVTRRGEEISAWVTTDGVVDAAVRTNFNGVGDSFGEKTILVDIRLVEKVCSWLAVISHMHDSSIGILYTVE
jgi:hypothetical protein